MALKAFVHMTSATGIHSAKCDVMAGSLILSWNSTMSHIPWEERNVILSLLRGSKYLELQKTEVQRLV